MKLSQKLANIAMDVSSQKLIATKSEIENKLTEIAKSGECYLSISTTTWMRNHRNLILKWLQDEGFDAKFTSSKCVDDFLNISF